MEKTWPHPFFQPHTNNQEDLDRGRWRAPTAADIINSYRGSGPRLRPEDVIVQENIINFSMRNLNPLDSVHFFDNLESVSKRALRTDQISLMVAPVFQVRVWEQRGG